MEKDIFSFIWRYSKKQQITIMVMTAVSLPFLYFVLDLPKYIINDAIDGKNFPVEFFGIEFDQIAYLLLLCAAFLVLLVINAVFSMVINTYKGVSSERLIRRLRYQLYEHILRFPPRHFQKVTPPELSAMITAEVEPMADFISDSFSMPMVQGGTMLTILFFMISEDPILGIVAISMVPVQAYVIPKLQRKVNLLGRERVFRARKLAGWVGESVNGIGDIHANDTSAYMQASLSEKLGGIFNVRYQLYQKKFFMKALNVFLSQLTPLFFYSIGGILIINGNLSLGALVAVLAAYARFTTPWKELLKYYQRYNDIKIKYEQLVEQFQPAQLENAERLLDRPEKIQRLKDPISLRNVRLVDEGAKMLDDVSVRIEPGDRIAIVSEPGSRDRFAHLIARLIGPTSGTISVGDANLAELPEAVTGAAIGYAGPESYIFDGSIEDNLLYGVKHAPMTNGKIMDENDFDYRESIASGNSVYDANGDWIDYHQLGLANESELKDWVFQVIRAVELDGLLAARSLGMGMDVEKYPDLAKRLVKARPRIASRLNRNKKNAKLIRPFAFDQYNANASVAANLVFGEPVSEAFEFRTLGSNELVRSVLEECNLTDRFLKIGQKLAETLIDLFGDMSPDQPLFETFSFVDKETLQQLKIITTNVNRDGVESLKEDEKTLLISLTFQVIIDRHRFGFIDEDIQARILKARRVFRKRLPKDEKDAIAFFDQKTFNAQLSNRCNLLMGRINHTVSGAEQKTNEITFEVLEEMNLSNEMILLATACPVGVGGSRLSHSDKQKITLARSLIKRPDIFVSNDALSSLDRNAQARIRRNIFGLLPDTTFVLFFSEMPDNSEFKQVLTLRDGRIADRLIEHRDDEAMPPAAEPEPAAAESEGGEDGAAPVILNAETAALEKIALFAGISQNHLKLLAFSSRRIDFAKGESLITEGELGKYAFVILGGEVEIVVGEGKNENVIVTYGKDTLVGELSLLTDALATATVRAMTPVTALRIEKEVFLQLMEGNSLIASQVASWVSNKLVHQMKLFNEAA
ncbi:MAG: ABC transporter transmembrane domain-containing protein [Hyphomicrobiaceae bacterium]|nr:ABC transporter transmembrane domain-containing protein [Hyphomicrobiaceae bacterium]